MYVFTSDMSLSALLIKVGYSSRDTYGAQAKRKDRLGNEAFRRILGQEERFDWDISPKPISQE